MSGTAVKAVIAYVSDYISKVSLKSYQLFASVFQVFESSAESMEADIKSHDKSRHMMRKMVNSLSTKMEIGSPMASMYVLGDPDHYSSHLFVPFAWRSYSLFVRKFWHTEDVADTEGEVLDEKVEITASDGNIFASSAVDDYRFRPLVFEHMSLYEWVQCSVKKIRTSKQRKEFAEELELDKALHFRASSPLMYPFMPSHPRYMSHHVSCDFTKLRSVIPNFIGGALPRADKGDRGFYCLTM
ncbi:hypothetical protein B0H16DRAFT_1337936, partial [Mycena metata]